MFQLAVSYTARLEDGTVFEKKGIDGETLLEFVTDEGIAMDIFIYRVFFSLTIQLQLVFVCCCL